MVLDFLAVDNFDFTRKLSKKIWVKNSWKCWGFVKIEFLDKNLTIRIVWKIRFVVSSVHIDIWLKTNLTYLVKPVFYVNQKLLLHQEEEVTNFHFLSDFHSTFSTRKQIEFLSFKDYFHIGFRGCSNFANVLRDLVTLALWFCDFLKSLKRKNHSNLRASQILQSFFLTTCCDCCNLLCNNFLTLLPWTSFKDQGSSCFEGR